MHRLAHHVSGGLIVTLPGPEEDHNPATGARLSELLKGRSDIPYEKRIEVARLIEDLTASNQGGWYSVISLHGGGSPEAMKMEIWRNYPLGNKVDLVERLLERGVLADATRRIREESPAGPLLYRGVCRALARGGGADSTQKERLTAHRSTATLNPPIAMRLASNGMSLGSIIAAMRSSFITFLLTASRWARDL